MVKFPETKPLAEGLSEKTLSMLDEPVSKTVYKSSWNTKKKEKRQ